MKYKKSQGMILTFIAAGIIIVVFLAGFAYFFNQMTNVLVNIPASTNLVNISDAAQKILVPVNTTMQNLNLLSLAIIIGLIIAGFVEAYYIRKPAILLAVHLLILFAAIAASIYVSNQYQILMVNPILGSYISAHTAVSWININLPTITAVLGFLELIFAVIAINRDPDISRGEI